MVVAFNGPVLFGIRAGINLQASSATPYTITTGRDDNADTVFNDRPVRVGRNSERGTAHVNGTMRFTRSFTIGGATAGGPRSTPSSAGDAPGGSAEGSRAAQHRVDVYAQVSNPFNYVNDNAIVGNQLSPFFGRATSAGPARRVELGMSLNF